MTSRRITVVASEMLGVPGTGGPGTADTLLAVALGRRGHRVDLLVAPGREVGQLSPEWEQIYGAAGVRVRRLQQHVRVRPGFLGPTAAVLDALRADPPDVVVADDWRGLAYASLRLRQLGAGFSGSAFVLYCHGPARVLAEAARKVTDTVARIGEEVAQRACIELADAVVSPSEWLLGWMRAHDWPVPDSARVVQNLWQSVALGEPAARAATGSRVRRLAFFGQLREGKGVDVYVESLRRLEAGLVAGVELLFLGRETPRWTAERVRGALGEVSDHVSSIRFEPGLERSDALQELLVPGTLAVMPSLLENSPYAVAECIEHAVPFLAAHVGGVPELVAAEDRERVLLPPTPDAFSAALSGALAAEAGFAPARPALQPESSLESWLDLVEEVAPTRRRTAEAPRRVVVVASGSESARRARRLAEHTRTVEVDVVAAESRDGVDQVTADWVVFLDDEDIPDDGLLDALVAAQAASDADVVTAAVRPLDDPGGARLFLGDPGALGLLENHYGVMGLVRRSLVAAEPWLDGIHDPDWLLFSRLALGGARVVSLPDALSEHRGRPGTIGDVPGVGLAVLETFEQRAASVRDLPQLTAALAVSSARLELERRAPGTAGAPARRALRALRRRVVAALGRR